MSRDSARTLPFDARHDAPAVALSLSGDTLRPLIAAVVEATVAAIRADEQKLSDRLCYSEEEASRLLGIEPHVLRDERRRGRIGASQIVARRIRYTREDLLTYLAERRTTTRNRD